MKRCREMEVKSEIRSAIEELSLLVKVRPPESKVKAGDNHEAEAETAAAAAADSIQVQQEDVKIPIRPFLSLSSIVLQVLDKIGPTMAVLRQDINQNIQRLEVLYETDPALYSNLVEVLKKEADGSTYKKSTSCSRAILWLTRSLDFTAALLERIGKNQGQNMEQVVEESYSIALKPWHGWISSAAFRVALKLVPDSQTLVNILRGRCEENSDNFKEDLQALVSLLVPYLNEIHSTLELFNLNRLKAT